MGVVLLLGVTLLTLIVLLSDRDKTQERENARERWKKLLESVGLKIEEQSEPLTGQGVLDGVEVEAELTLQRSVIAENTHHILHSLVSARVPGLPSGLLLRGDAEWDRPLVEDSEQSLGDERLDGKVDLSSFDAPACAALSRAARELLVPFLRQGGRVEGGRVIWDAAWTQQTGWRQEQHAEPPLLERLHQATELAQRLSVSPQQLHQRLAENATQDPERKIRLRNLRFLVAPELQAPPQLLASSARSLLADEYIPVRLLAALQLGAEGHAVLRSLAADSDVPQPERLRAIQGLGQGLEPDLAGLKALLLSARPPAIHAAALAAVPASASALLDTVLHHVQSKEESVRAAAARALGVLALPSTEPVLLQLLADDSSYVQQASAQALGTFASVAAVERLLPLSRAFLDSQLRQSARAAVSSIQARLGDVEAGRVSLAEPHELAGAVALADGAAAPIGNVSLSEEQIHGEEVLSEAHSARAQQRLVR